MDAAVTTTPTLHQRLERQLNALLSISRRWRLYDDDITKAFKAITEAAAEALAVDRASVWFLDDSRDALICHDLYEMPKHRHSRGYKLQRTDHPDYFKALETEEIVVASDAVKDPRTRSFRRGYLEVHGIGAMLDTPIRVGGKLVGVLCNEYVGESRLFLADEQTTARLLGNLASLASESRARADSQQKEARALALFTAAIESAKIGVIATTLDGELTFFNEYARQIYDFPDELLKGKDREARIRHTMQYWKHPEKVLLAVRKALAAPDGMLDDLPIELKDGRMLECSCRPQVVDGTVVGRVWTLRDITDRG